MAKWLDPITAAVADLTAKNDRQSEEIERLHGELRAGQERIRALEYRERARFAPMARSGE